MPTVFIPKEYGELVERMAKNKYGSIGGKPVFSNYMHFMVFASFVGRNKEKRWQENEVKTRGNEISDYIFTRSNMDGSAYLLALHA